MKKINIFIFAFIILLMNINSSYAQLEYTKLDKKIYTPVTITSFNDYPPFAIRIKTLDESKPEYNGVLPAVLEKILDDYKYYPIYSDNKDFRKNLKDVKFGRTNIFLGMYHTDDLNSGVNFAMPAIFTNPITVMMKPEKISLVNDVKDLKPLKAVVRNDEYLGEFVRDRLKQLDFDVKYVDTAYEAFDEIISGRRDYLITSKYNGIAKALEFGVFERVSFAKNAIWNLQMFIAFSKTSLKDSKNVKELKKQIEAELRNLSKTDTVTKEIEKQLKLIEYQYINQKARMFSGD